MVVNAAGPWVNQVVAGVAGLNATRSIRLVKGSHIVVRKFWDGPQAYLIQNDDKRVIFVNPYEGDLCLIGTTDIPYDGAPEDVAIDDDEIAYLLAVVNRYFERQLSCDDILHSFSGVRPLTTTTPRIRVRSPRDYSFEIDTPDGGAPMLSIFGGKITTFRKLAEHALDRFAPFFPGLGTAWTAGAPLPGGDMAAADFAAFVDAFRAAHPWLPASLARHLARLYGTRAERVLDGASALDDLGRHFGGHFYEREARYLIEQEWATTAEDILERRTKHGLHLSPEERCAFEAWCADSTTASPT